MRRTAATLCFLVVIASPLTAMYALRSEIQSIRAEIAVLRQELAAAPKVLGKTLAGIAAEELRRDSPSP